MHRRWLVQRTNPEYIDYLSGAAGITPATAQVLINRGVKTPEEVALFRSQEPGGLSDPAAIDGMQAMVDAIIAARRDARRVFVHGDYDADGVTSTSILVTVLRRLGLEVHYKIPNRFRDGYGFHPAGVREAQELGAGLIITTDCGITSFEAAEEALRAHIDLIITDHHEPVAGPDGPRLPEALAIVNPKLGGPPTDGLCAAGVALKVAAALNALEPGLVPDDEFLDLAALGTVADSVPLTGENRVIVKHGLVALQEARRPGVRALKAASSLGKRAIKAGLISFTLIPRINAAGRLADAAEVVEMMMTESEDTARTIARKLSDLNSERQKIEEQVLKEAVAIIEARGVGPSIVLRAEGWHEGVLGIVASRMADKYNRPAFVLSVTDGVAKGSARSVQGFDIHAGLGSASDRLLGYGGHKQAAGLRLNSSELEAFAEEMDAITESALEDFTPVLKIDATVELKEISFGLVKEVAALEPFGYGNPEPVFGSKSLEVVNARVVGNNHLKLKLRQGNCAHDAIGWGMGEQSKDIPGLLDVAYTATMNDWEGGRTVQLVLKGIRPSA